MNAPAYDGYKADWISNHYQEGKRRDKHHRIGVNLLRKQGQKYRK